MMTDEEHRAVHDALGSQDTFKGIGQCPLLTP
jgi:hypothetical protein